MMERSVDEELRKRVATTVAETVKSYNLPAYCESLGLAPGTEQSASASKRLYVLNRLPKQADDVLPIAEKVLGRFPNFALQEAMWQTREANVRVISEITRRAVLDQLVMMMSARGLGGKLGLPQFVKRLWPLDEMPSSDCRFENASGDFWQHTVVNSDWDVAVVFDRLDLLSCSEHLFLRFIEELLHPIVRGEGGQRALADALNPLLARDGMELRAADSVSGFLIYRCVAKRPGVQGGSKNIIFAANGPKPKIVLRDAINNDVEIVENAQYCLVFDRPIPATGLRMKDLAEWWAASKGGDPADKELWRVIYRRMEESVQSPPERILFRAYYKKMMVDHGADLPALLPQVYLHFDPLTARERGGSSAVARQRMDFLVLLSSRERIVIEVDGKQHYADDNGIASPPRYAGMVAEDRELRLAGYEVFRFGGAELSDSDGERVAHEFFTRLLGQRCR